MGRRSGGKKTGDRQKDSILESLFEQRGINVKITKDTNIGELLQIDRNSFYDVNLDSEKSIKMYCKPEEFTENINNILIIHQILDCFLKDDVQSDGCYSKDSVAKHPYLRLYFAGGYSRGAPDYKEIKPRATMNLRLDKFTIFSDKIENNESLLSKTDFKYFSDKVSDNFFPGGSPFTWEKGYYSWPYKDEEKNITIAPRAKNEAEALRVIKAALNTIDIKFEDKHFFLPNGAKNPARYKRKKNILILGQEFPDRRLTRIIGTVSFRYAEIRLDAIKYRIKICEVTKDGIFIGWDKIPKPAHLR